MSCLKHPWFRSRVRCAWYFCCFPSAAWSRAVRTSDASAVLTPSGSADDDDDDDEEDGCGDASSLARRLSPALNVSMIRSTSQHSPQLALWSTESISR
jgi:hypothetical protein